MRQATDGTWSGNCAWEKIDYTMKKYHEAKWIFNNNSVFDTGKTVEAIHKNSVLQN